MSASHIAVREIIGWGIDTNPYLLQGEVLTQALERTKRCAKALAPFVPEDPRIDEVPEEVKAALAEESLRPDLIEEMDGLEWTTGVIDLTMLIAFQRRIAGADATPVANNWASLIAIAFGPIAPIVYQVVERSGSAITLHADNPNLQFRPGTSVEAPLVLHGGSPFFEVAEYRGRWFLRDGYHRAYRLLNSGITRVPAVIIRAKTLAELGSVQPWFFTEELLFSRRPPLVSDFLNDKLTMTYTRPKLRKVLRVTMEDTVEPATTQYLKEMIS